MPRGARSARARWLRSGPRERLPVLVVTLLAGTWIGPAIAQDGSGDPLLEERFAFEAADTDGDGRVNEAELARDAARGFATLDKDGSGTLVPAELGPHEPAQFRRVDANSDGALTFEEVMRHKIQAFGTGDKDIDGGLSFEEMLAAVQAETGATP